MQTITETVSRKDKFRATRGRIPTDGGARLPNDPIYLAGAADGRQSEGVDMPESAPSRDPAFGHGSAHFQEYRRQ